jgi:hypothetical protein
LKTKLPRRSNEWAARGFIITFFLCLAMVCLGLFGAYRLIVKPKPIFLSFTKPKITYHKNWLSTKNKKDYLEIVLDNNTAFRTELTKNEEDNYLKIGSFTDVELQRKIDSLPFKSSSLETKERKKERIRQLQKVEKHIENIQLKYFENGSIIYLKLNEVIIRKERNLLWVVIPILTIGTILTGLHLRFFIKDPYNAYQNMKDPFSKYKLKK